MFFWCRRRFKMATEEFIDGQKEPIGCEARQTRTNIFSEISRKCSVWEINSNQPCKFVVLTLAHPKRRWQLQLLALSSRRGKLTQRMSNLAWKRSPRKRKAWSINRLGNKFVRRALIHTNPSCLKQALVQAKLMEPLKVEGLGETRLFPRPISFKLSLVKRVLQMSADSVLVFAGESGSGKTISTLNIFNDVTLFRSSTDLLFLFFWGIHQAHLLFRWWLFSNCASCLPNRITTVPSFGRWKTFCSIDGFGVWRKRSRADSFMLYWLDVFIHQNTLLYFSLISWKYHSRSFEE